jgi:hypothetical protein
MAGPHRQKGETMARIRLTLSCDTWRPSWEGGESYPVIVEGGRRDESAQVWNSRESALDDLFQTYAHGGTPIAYAGDGFILCAECARANYEENKTVKGLTESGPGLSPWLMDGDHSNGEYCECGKEIVAPYCADCADEDFNGGVFVTDSGEKVYCHRCMARFRLNGFGPPAAYQTVAHRVRPGLYRLTEYRPGWGKDAGLILPQYAGVYYLNHSSINYTKEDFDLAYLR